MTLIFNIKPSNIKRLLIDGLFFGSLNITIPFYLTAVAEKTVTSSIAAITNGLTPLMALLVGFLLSKSHFQSKKMLAKPQMIISMIFALIAVFLLDQDSVYQLGSVNIAMLIAISISYAAAVNYVKFYAGDNNFILLACVSSLISLVIMFCIQYITSGWIWHFPVHPQSLLALIWLGVISSGVCLILYCILIQRMGAVLASSLTYLMILTGVLSGMLFLHEKMTLPILISCLCILASLSLLYKNTI